MGQSRSKPSTTSTLSSNSWRRLSDSDCLHLLSHPEYFDNQLISIEQQQQYGQTIPRSGSTSIFFDTIDNCQQLQPPPRPPSLSSSTTSQHYPSNNQNVTMRSISMNSTSSKSYRNSMYPGSLDNHHHFCMEHDNNRSMTPSSLNTQSVRNTPPPPPPQQQQQPQPSLVSPPILQSSSSSMNTGQLTARIRPLSMFGGPSTLVSLNNNKSLMLPPSLLPKLSDTSKQLENLSLDDLLEQVNQTESSTLHHHHWIMNDNDGDTDSGQTLVAKHSDSSSDCPNDHQTIVDSSNNNDSIKNFECIDQSLPTSSPTTPPPPLPPPPPHTTQQQTSNGSLRHHHGNNSVINGRLVSSSSSSSSSSTNPIRCSGLDCMCERCVQNRFKLLNWLLPNCTRLNSERLLSGKPDGTFLVRKSEKFPGQYTLSFVCRRTVRHCLIMRSVYGFGLRWPYSFETLQQVIIHYSQNSLTEFNSKLNIRLRYPVFSA
ncbi:uncharacterized protein LOC124490550 [Dermatophagoides farinae]|uniref:uncharacterized protein LOC124490550 n=1 Tax=Dermatophagoides farinae TaxID=6954 RepID=UPI003F61328B